MSKQLISTGAILLEDNCDVISVANWTAVAIADKQTVAVDDNATSSSPTQGTIGVITCTTALEAKGIGVAVGAIPAAVTSGGVTTPGVGQIAIGGLARVKLTGGSAAVTAGVIYEFDDAGCCVAGSNATKILGKCILSETTAYPLIQLCPGQ
jgi:hypothetical protein